MKLRLAIVIGCGLAASLGSYAQTGGIRGGIHVKVPFDFFVASKAFPAGEYAVSSMSDSVVIWDARGNRVAMALSNSIRRNGGDTGEVVFACYAARCYLSELRTPDPGRSRALLRAKEEIELAKQQPAKPFVLVGTRAK